MTIDLVINLITAVASAIAVAVSLFVYHQTSERKYEGKLFPSCYLQLSWIPISDGPDDPLSPCIITDCTFLNMGSKVGHFDGMLLTIQNLETGTETVFRNLCFSDSIVDLFFEEGTSQESLHSPSTVWLGPNESKRQSLVFVPNECTFDILKPAIIKVTLSYSSKGVNESVNKKWEYSDIVYSYNVMDEDITAWSVNKEPRRLEAIELTTSMKKHLRH